MAETTTMERARLVKALRMKILINEKKIKELERERMEIDAKVKRLRAENEKWEDKLDEVA